MPNYRQTWWLTRPVRTPVAHDLAIKAFSEVANEKVWEGNRDLHREFEEKLAEAGLKRDTISKDGSGGRTWASMLRVLGFWFPSEIDGKVVLTEVAEALINQNQIREYITKQILNFQIPNSYYLSKNFKKKPDPSFKIFPFRFMLKLLLDDDINYLAQDEIALFVITAKTNDDLSKVKENILKYREMSKNDGKELKERTDLINQLKNRYNARTRKDANRDYFEHTGDIAHTHMIYLSYIDGIEKSESKVFIKHKKKEEFSNLLEFYEKRYPFSQRYRISDEIFSGHYGLELGKFKYSKKPGAPPVASQASKIISKVNLALNKLSSENPVLETGEKIIELLQTDTGLEKEQIERVLESEHPNFIVPKLSMISQEFIEEYLEVANDGNRWQEFEEMTRKIFKELGYNIKTKVHTKECRIIDALLLDNSTKHSGIVDAKSGETYALSSKDSDLMITSYIPQFRSYQANGEPYELIYFIYVVGDKFKGKKNLTRIFSKTKISGSVINARQLLLLMNLKREKQFSLNVLEDLFKLNKPLTIVDILTYFNND